MKIGLSLPLSVASEEDADVRSVGVDVRNAAEFARSVLGIPAELLIVDNRQCTTDPRKIIDTFKAAAVDAVLGLPTSDEVKAHAAPLAEAGLVAITPMATSPALADYPHIFRTRVSDRHAAKLVAGYLSRAGYGTVGVLSEDSAYSLDCASAVAQFGRKQGLRFVEQVIRIHQRGMQRELQLLHQEGIEALFINSQDEAGYVRCVTEARRTLGDIQLFGCAMPGSRTFRELAGSAAEGIIYVSEPRIDQTLTPYGRRVLDEFRVSYGAPRTGEYAIAFTFAALFALHRAHQAGGNIAAQLACLEFHDPVNGAFCFRQNEITSLPAATGGNRFADHRLMRIIGSGAEVLA